jgi:hypothetical protein
MHMSLYPLFVHVLLYFVSVSALLVLFAVVFTILVWLLGRLRRLGIRLLGGTIADKG